MKKFAVGVLCSLLAACGMQNNVSFTTQNGKCADGATNAPYCMAVTIQNNNGGQNWITSTSMPLNNLTLTVAGASNVGYPTSQGSNFDPNNCLGSAIAPGSSCTFYLWLNGESAPVGTTTPITIAAKYNVSNSWLGTAGGSSSSSSTLTVYEQPNLIISSSLGSAQAYNNKGFSTPYRGESENVVNAVTNDNYYGFLYIGGNNGVYFSGNGNYVGNATNKSNSIKGAGNLVVSGTTLYATPSNIAALPSVYSAQMQKESFSWQLFASGLSSVTPNIMVQNGGAVYVVGTTQVYRCSTNTSGGSGCNNEGLALGSPATQITAIAYSPLGVDGAGNAFTGLVVGSDSGAWAEVGTIGLATNTWAPVTISGSQQVITSAIVKIVGDAKQNLYLMDNGNNLYRMQANTGNVATFLGNLSVLSGTGVKAMVYDNAGQKLYVGSATGDIYACSTAGGNFSCDATPLTSAFGVNLFGLNIITSLVSG